MKACTVRIEYLAVVPVGKQFEELVEQVANEILTGIMIEEEIKRIGLSDDYGL